MKKLILAVHTSFDGYVSNLDGELIDFIGDEELLAFTNQLAETADTVLLGRCNFDGMEAYWVKQNEVPNATVEEIKFSSWYKNAVRAVASTTLKATSDQIKVINKIPEDIITLKNRNDNNILLFGSMTLAHSLFEHDLIDEIWWYAHPRIFGSGIPLFKDEHKKLKLVRNEVRPFSNGVTGIHYLVEK